MKTKKIIISTLAILSLFTLSQVNAVDTDTQLTATKTLNPNFEIKKFSSCTDMKKVIKDYVKNNYNSFPNYPYYRGGSIMLDDAIAETSTISKDAAI
jgi:hypothetical protein